LALLGEQGGWPLTMFLNSKGEPFWGGTYFPKENNYGRPGFTHVLTSVAGIFRTEPEKVAKNRDILKTALKKQNQTPEGDRPKLTLEVLDRIAERYAEEADPLYGGIGSAPKFPQTYVLENLWRSYIRTDKQTLSEIVVKALTAMSQGGIYDHLGGGYARYSTDAEWLAPHFEKMLYDNALILDLMLLVHGETKTDLFEDRIYQTVGWLLREMIAENGAFCATIDADSEGVEGKFYTWSANEIRDLLGSDAEQFSEFYDVSLDGNWENTNILNRLEYQGRLDEDLETNLKKQREILLKAREKRIRPETDTKVLTDWNGLMIATLAKAGHYFARTDWLERAENAFLAITSTVMTEDNRLFHSYRQGQAKHTGTLDDYANMSRAALLLHEITGKAFYLERAQEWFQILNTHFWDSEGGYFYTADDAEALIVRTKNAHDNAVPAGNGTMLEVLARLHYLTGDREPFEKATDIVRCFSAELGRNFFPLATFLNNFETLIEGKQILIVGKREDQGTKNLLSVLRDFSLPAKVVNVMEDLSNLPADHPANGKSQKDGKSTAYICTGPTCSLPANNPVSLRTLLEGK
ncbi:MAG: thioredoxin domain-containing protein, partial [Sneathiellales bacterium]|nr:thioredoxin domain-containing protein [Sneathiellales bacterium]